MAVRIRLSRIGQTHRPMYRVVATDSRRQRSGAACEILGTYNPHLAEKNIQVDIERVHAWLRQGALFTDSVESLLKREGYEVVPAEVVEAKAKQAAKRKTKRLARKKSAETAKGTFVKPSRRAVLKHKAKLKAERMAQQAEALAAHKAAAAAASEGEAEADAEG
ncbi:MAG: 30S ribosomal protein S16 [Planctomycetota bacterium]